MIVRQLLILQAQIGASLPPARKDPLEV